MTKYDKVFILLLALFCWGTSLAANPQLESQLQAEIDAFLAENPEAPGISAYLVCPELGLDWEAAAGTVAKDNSDALTARHTFRIASNTKTYVATAILRLVEMGRLDLEENLAHYLAPDLAAMLSTDGYDLEAITLAHVLSHTAGLADHTGDPRYEEKILSESYYQWTSDEQLRALVDWMEPLGDPGEAYSYSDSGYIILGTIIERLTGKKLGPAVRELVDFEKLGLRTTFWEYMEEPRPDSGPRAHQYFGDLDVTGWNASFDLYGGGGMITDAVELAQYMRLLLKGEVLSEESTLVQMTGRGTETYRLGLIVMDFEGHLGLGHLGFWNTFAYHVPSLDLSLGGGVMNHHATHCKELVARLVKVVARAQEK